MSNLPYFFLLLKKNIALWTLIATGSFSNIDTSHTEYIRTSPNFMILIKYDTFEKISIISTKWETSINFETLNSKYQDSLKHYFGTDLIHGSVTGGYTLNNITVNTSTDMLEPIDIGLNRKENVFLARLGEHKYRVSLILQAKNYRELRDKFLDSVRKINSAIYGLRGGPAPYVEKLIDSAMRVGFGDEKKYSDFERNQLIGQSINIINKAIKADSTYVNAYELKFGWEGVLKHYDSLIVTGKKILKLASDTEHRQIVYKIGECYELTGHADSAEGYYQRALSLYEQGISKMRKNDMAYSFEMSNKALVLILLNMEREGRAIFKELAETSGNQFDKQFYQNCLETPREKFLRKLQP